MTIGIVEDKEHLREWFSSLLRRVPELEWVTAYKSSEEALSRLSGTCCPDVMLMDIDLPGMSGIECAQILKNRCPHTQIMMLTVFENEERIFQALQAGATGYILKKTPPDEIIKSVVEMKNGGSPMSMPIARKVVQMFQRLPAMPSQTTIEEELSQREREILTYLAKGYMYKEIATQFDISVHTVRSHLRKIYEKLHVKTRTEATAKFLQHA